MKTNFNRLTVKVYAWFAKPLNASSGTNSYLMKGGEIPYYYQGKANVKVSELEEFILINKDRIFDNFTDLQVKAEGKESDAKIKVSLLKKEFGSSRVVKGVRGTLRHSIMRILHKREIDYCSPTQKERYKGSEEPTLLDGEHLMSACGEAPCPMRQLFGAFHEKSPIRVWSDAIIQTDKPLDKITEQTGISFVHVSTENRHQARRDSKTLQDFSEQYFSGAFQFYIEFTKELPQWLLGLLIEGILGIRHLGAGSNSGYGRVEIQNIAFEKITLERKLGQENGDGRIAIIEEEYTENMNGRISEVLEAWQKHN